MEQDASYVKSLAGTVASVCGPHYSTSKLNEVVESFSERVGIAEACLNYDINNIRTKKSKLQSSAEQLVAAYKAMEASGEIERILERHRKIIEKTKQ